MFWLLCFADASLLPARAHADLHGRGGHEAEPPIADPLRQGVEIPAAGMLGKDASKSRLQFLHVPETYPLPQSPGRSKLP
jgi:hypothetical protein